MRFLSIILLLSVSACATPEQRTEETVNYINAHYGPVCEKLGYEPGSEKHRDCMVSMFNTDQMRYAPGLYGGFYGGMGVWGPRVRRR